MGFSRRIGLGQSFNLAQKSVATLVLAFTLTGAGCSSGSKQPSNVAPSIQSMQSGSGLRLTSIGVNKHGRFSPNGKKVLFISSEREFHKQAQVYELDLENFRERRLTFDDGQALEADYSPDGQKILYASTTDEIKERPVLLNPQKNLWPATELYLSDSRGTQIERLTRKEGFQGEFNWVGAGGGRLLFSSQTGSRLEIGTLTLPEDHFSVWQSDPSSNLRLPTVDATGTRVAWLVQAEGQPLKIGLKLKGKVSAFESPFGEVQSLQWILGSQKNPLLLMSAKQAKDKFLQAWILDPEKTCISAFINDSGNLKDLQVGPKQEKLLFSFETGGRSQLFLRELPPLPANCETFMAAQTSVPAKPAGDPQADPKKP